MKKLFESGTHSMIHVDGFQSPLTSSLAWQPSLSKEIHFPLEASWAVSLLGRVKKVLGGKFSMLATEPLLATLRHQACYWHLDFHSWNTLCLPTIALKEQINNVQPTAHNRFTSSNKTVKIHWYEWSMKITRSNLSTLKPCSQYTRTFIVAKI